MARIRRGNLVSLLSRLLDITYDQAVAVLAGAIPSIDVSVREPEDWFVVGHRLGWGGANVAAPGAGLRAAVGLENLSTLKTPGIVVVTETILMFGAAAFGNRIMRTASPGLITGTTTVRTRDTQALPIGSASMPITQIRSDNTQTAAAMGGDLVSSGLGLANSIPYTILSPYVFGPGICTFFEPAADAVAMSATFFWREFDLGVSPP